MWLALPKVIIVYYPVDYSHLNDHAKSRRIYPDATFSQKLPHDVSVRSQL